MDNNMFNGIAEISNQAKFIFRSTRFLKLNQQY